MFQMNLFGICGDENNLATRHLTETYPGTSTRHVRTQEFINNVESQVYDNLKNDGENSSNNGGIGKQNKDSGDWTETESSSEIIEDLTTLNKSMNKKDWNLDRINNLREKLHQRRLMNPLNRHTRQVDSNEVPRLKMDKPFIYFVRHNPTGLILHIGRFNPKHQS